MEKVNMGAWSVDAFPKMTNGNSQALPTFFHEARGCPSAARFRGDGSFS
jgi:hypothetical protein